VGLTRAGAPGPPAVSTTLKARKRQLAPPQVVYLRQAARAGILASAFFHRIPRTSSR
jgi:hypothetical protein